MGDGGSSHKYHPHSQEDRRHQDCFEGEHWPRILSVSCSSCLRRSHFPVQLVHLNACADIPAQFFSSYERLRLAKDGSYPIQVSKQDRKPRKVHRSATTRAPEHKQRVPIDRHFSFPITSLSTGSRRRPATASQVPRAFNPTDAIFYESLPPTLRSKLFSREEQVLLASQRGSVIADAADEVLYKRGHQTHLVARGLQSAASLPLFRDLDTAERKTLDNDSQMDHSAFEGFRWLESPDKELDLKLDDYHTAVTETTTNAKLPARQSSFRRNMSLSMISFSRRGSVSEQNIVPASPRHSSVSSNQVRPISSLLDSHKHRSHSSISSIDPSAKYYRDPEARLKLRVYLASPQKFDEAIEFGFPSRQDRQTIQHARQQASPRITQDSARTFFTDDTPSLSEGDDDDKDEMDYPPDTPQDAEFRRFSKKSSSERTGISRPQLRLEPYALASTHDREMTLHMTLTRPDLRSADEIKPAKRVNDLPLEHEALPCDDVPKSIWDTLPEDSSVVKKLWRRLRRM
jgi:hypothetical protein